jgi:hypothetical protein
MTSGGGAFVNRNSRQATSVDNHVCQEVRHDAPKPRQWVSDKPE